MYNVSSIVLLLTLIEHDMVFMSRKGPQDGLRDVRLHGGLNMWSYELLLYNSYSLCCGGLM